MSSSREEFYTDALRFGPRDDLSGWPMTNVIPMWGSRINRKYGRDWYQFRTELDLLLQRDAVRHLCNSNPMAMGVVDDISSFVVGTGYTPKVAPPRGLDTNAAAKTLSRDVEQYLQDWAERTPTADDLLSGDYAREPSWRHLELECYKNERIDGEGFVRLFYDRAKGLVCRRVEPEFVACPFNEDPNGDWGWGLLNAPDDPAKILTFNVRDPITLEDIETPANRMLQCKSNVVSTIKRGVSDFFPVLDDAKRIDALLDALLLGAKIRASIAFIESIQGGARGAVDDVKTRLATRFSTDPITGQVVTERKIRPGTIQTSNGVTDVKTMPQGTTAESIQAAEFAMRYFARKWGLPENMISGNVGNFNYSTMLAAGTPFTRRIQSSQGKYGNEVVLPVYVHAVIAGVFAGHLPWDALQCRVSVVAPNPVMGDKLQDAQVQALRLQSKVISPQKAMQENGDDPEKVMQEWADYEDRFPAQTVPPGLDSPFGDSPRANAPTPHADGTE